MTITDIVKIGGIAALVASVAIEIVPIKINPWSAIFGWLGRAINREILSETKETRKVLDEHIKVDDERNADNHRQRILRFNDEVVRGVEHTEEHFIEIMLEIDKYNAYCDSHPDYKNRRAVRSIANIERVYDERMVKNDFL